MNSVTSCSWKDSFNQSSATLFPSLLVIADSAFILVHWLNALSPAFSNPLYSIEHNRGHAEIYQYIKWFWVMYLFGRLSVLRRSPQYLAWGLVFTYFLCDDALSLHEKFGAYLGAKLHLAPLFGLRLRDYGEIAASVGAGIILSSGIIVACILGSSSFRKMSVDLTFLVGCLAFFGIFVDMLHVLIRQGREVAFLLGLIEDGGEMLVGSFLAYYVFLLSVRDERSAVYLCDLIPVPGEAPALGDHHRVESSRSSDMSRSHATGTLPSAREFGPEAPRRSDSSPTDINRNRGSLERTEPFAGGPSRRVLVARFEVQPARRRAAR